MKGARADDSPTLSLPLKNVSQGCLLSKRCSEPTFYN